MLSFRQMGIVVMGALVAGVAGAQTVKVEILEGMKFSPENIQIAAGDTIEFVNNSRFAHTVTADPSLAKNPANVILPEGAAPFHSGKLNPGDTFSHTFSEVGQYQYICLPHEMHGMKGQVHVVAAEVSHNVDCEVSYFLDAQEKGQAKFSGSVKDAGGIAISQDFDLAAITANLHVYYEPMDRFVSVNYFHEPTGSYVNADTYVVAGKMVSLVSRNVQINPGIDSVSVSCTFN